MILALEVCQTPILFSKPKSDDASFGKPFLAHQLIDLISKSLLISESGVFVHLGVSLGGAMNSLKIWIIFLSFLHLECLVCRRDFHECFLHWIEWECSGMPAILSGQLCAMHAMKTLWQDMHYSLWGRDGFQGEIIYHLITEGQVSERQEKPF